MSVILRKTEAGIQALQSREASYRLPARLRTLLLQVDNQKRTSELARLAVSLGSPTDAVEKLMEMGLVEIVSGSKIHEPTPAPKPIAAQRGITAAALAEVAGSPPVQEFDTESEGNSLTVTTTDRATLTEPAVCASLPQLLHPVALLMQKIADTHLGTRATMLKRRISKSETEAELRLSLMALRDALAKATDLHHADTILYEVYLYLPMSGLTKAQIA